MLRLGDIIRSKDLGIHGPNHYYGLWGEYEKINNCRDFFGGGVLNYSHVILSVKFYEA